MTIEDVARCQDRHCEERRNSEAVIPGMVRQHQTPDVQLHIGESRDSGFDASHRPGMTAWV
jgi:hypothetical protein